VQNNTSLGWSSKQELLNTKLYCQTPDWIIRTWDIRMAKNACTLPAVPLYTFAQRSAGICSLTYWRGLGVTCRDFRYILSDMTTVAVLTILFTASLIFVIWSFTLDLHIISSRCLWQAGKWETRFQIQSSERNEPSGEHSWRYLPYVKVIITRLERWIYKPNIT
jgi:hypothetical protein